MTTTNTEKLAADLKAAVIDDLQQAYDMLYEARDRIRATRHYVRVLTTPNSYADCMLAEVDLDGDIGALASALIALKG